MTSGVLPFHLSRGSARERGDKVSSPTATVAARVTPFPRGSGAKEPGESQAPEELSRDAAAAPRHPAAATAGERGDVESGRPREAGEGGGLASALMQDIQKVGAFSSSRLCLVGLFQNGLD